MKPAQGHGLIEINHKGAFCPFAKPDYSKYFLFVISTSIYIIFLTPNINSGDAGELITSSYLMGVAHPPGYPLYMILGKLITFLPAGNIAFRIALLSAVFSGLTLVIFYKIAFTINRDDLSSYAGAFALLTSYSYFGQSIIAKFYTLNLFIILLILYNLFCLIDSEDLTTARISLKLSFMLLGLTCAHHHTGIIMSIPILFTLTLRRKVLSPKTIISTLLCFLAGFAINAYVFLRSGPENFFSVQFLTDIKSVIALILREPYGQGSTPNAAKSLINNLDTFLFAVKNLMFITSKTFGYYSFILFAVGLLHLFLKAFKKGFLLAVCLLLYGPIFSKMTMANAQLKEETLYIVAHQYFLPFYSLFAVVCSTGLSVIIGKLPLTKFKSLKATIGFFVVTFTLLPLFSRATDSNYATNYVPYQIAKDRLTSLPISSVILTYGDNANFSTWYIKLVGRFRDDICQLTAVTQDNVTWSYQGCRERLYKEIYPSVYLAKLSSISWFLYNNRFFSNAPIDSKFVFRDLLTYEPAGITYLYKPTQNYHKLVGEFFAGSVELPLTYLNRLITDRACLEHTTDDYFTRSICHEYVRFNLLTSLHSDQTATSCTNKQSKVFCLTLYPEEKDYCLPVCDQNLESIDKINKILGKASWKIFYLRK